MLTVSPDFLETLTGSHTPICRVDAWRDGVLMSGDNGLPVVTGSLSMTAGQAIRTSLQLTIADADGLWTPNATGALSPYGSELNVRLGVKVGAAPEIISKAWCPITTAGADRKHQVYLRRDGKSVMVPRGVRSNISGTDRAEIISREKFLTAQQPTAATILAEVGALLRDVVPWQAPTFADQPVPATITYEEDRLKAVQDLLAVLDADPVVTADGVVTAQKRAPGASVWTIPVGPQDDATLVETSFELSSDNVFNAVIARGTAYDGIAVIGRATIAKGPLAWDGPFGRVPYFFTAPTIGTQAQANQAAIDTLARLNRERVQILAVTCVSNPAIEVWDVVTLPFPGGSIDGQIISANWPIPRGKMTMQVAVDPGELAEVLG